jgi:hypothetical protein
MIAGIITRGTIGAALLFTLSSPAWPALVLHAPEGGAVRGVVIGIDHYPNLDGTAQLRGAVADAHDISGALKAAGVPDANVRMLTDGAAVRSRVIAEMDRLVHESQSGDLAIIAYSGHGMRAPTYKRWDRLIRSALQSQILMSNFGPSVENGHEIIVDGEMRAWFARLDAKGVDVVVVMDTSYGVIMRCPCVPLPGDMKARRLADVDLDDKVHDSFAPIPMTQKEARADVNELRHVTFMAGAADGSKALEMSGIDPANRTVVHGALSYFVARAFEGKTTRDGTITRAQLFKFLALNVREVTEGHQFIDFGPRAESDDAQQQVVFRIDDDAASGGEKQPGPLPQPTCCALPQSEPKTGPEAGP